MLVKICGITTQEAADTAVQAGADFIGFVFSTSKRQITAEDARAITSKLKGSVKKVGVFVNETQENIMQIAEQVGLDIIQLHGDETPEFAEQLPYPVMKAFSVRPDHLGEICHFPCDYYLLDSPNGKNRGGNGTTFNWDLLRDIRIEREKIFLAGGLNPDNILEAIATVNPNGVDVSSGVETGGRKDLAKIKYFIAKAKGKDEDLHDNI